MEHIEALFAKYTGSELDDFEYTYYLNQLLDLAFMIKQKYKNEYFMSQYDRMHYEYTRHLLFSVEKYLTKV